jgi:inorganic pyrophosphatase
MKFKNIPPMSKGMINVIIETPRDSQNKFDYDPDLGIFKLKKTLPMGTLFPFDFGFIPNTIAEDGDPVDVLVIMDQHAFPGCLTTCRVIGVLEAEQTESDKKKERNDRVVAIAACSILFGNITDVKELNKRMVEEIEDFFVYYNKYEGKKFVPIRWAGIETAMDLIRNQSVYKK